MFCPPTVKKDIDMPAVWEDVRREPSLAETMGDPIIQAIMLYDGLTEEDFSPSAEALAEQEAA